MGSGLACGFGPDKLVLDGFLSRLPAGGEEDPTRRMCVLVAAPRVGGARGHARWDEAHLDDAQDAPQRSKRPAAAPAPALVRRGGPLGRAGARCRRREDVAEALRLEGAERRDEDRAVAQLGREAAEGPIAAALAVDEHPTVEERNACQTCVV